MRFCDSCVPVRPVATSAYRTYAPPFVFRRGNPLVLRLRPSIGSSLSTDLSIVNRIAVTVSSVGKPMSFLSPVESPFGPQSARLVTHPNLFVPAVMTASHQFTLFHVLNSVGVSHLRNDNSPPETGRLLKWIGATWDRDSVLSFQVHADCAFIAPCHRLSSTSVSQINFYPISSGVSTPDLS